MQKVNLEEKYAQFSEQWSPRVIGRYEGHDVRISKLEGDFIWHSHEHDELFLVIEGELDLEFHDADTVTLKAGEMLIVPKGVEHWPRANNGEAKLFVMDPAGAPNTGDEETASTLVNI